MLRRHEQLAFPGSLHFVTTVTQVRGNWFVDDVICEKALSIFEDARNKCGVHCLGFVLMPDHLHAVLFQVEKDSRVSALMHSFKSRTAFKCWPEGYEGGSLWRRRYDDVPLPGPQAVIARLKYMHENPIRRGLVVNSIDYRWSSAQEYEGMSESIITLSRDLVSPGR